MQDMGSQAGLQAGNRRHVEFDGGMQADVLRIVRGDCRSEDAVDDATV
jgi:hypothetical protein